MARLDYRRALSFFQGDGRAVPVGRFMALVLLLIAAVASGVSVVGEQPSAAKDAPIPALEFSRMVREFSEPGGFFRSDNFISNETSYLHVIDLLREEGIAGDVYLGVGPEQNFTYIAKIRPRMAFIIDIRRQAMLQHLMYKALFHMASSRREFLSLLLSRPLNAATAASNSSLEGMVKYFWERGSDATFFEANLQKVIKYLQRECHIPLSSDDIEGLRFVYSSFQSSGLDVRYRIGRGIENNQGYTGYWDGAFPNLAEILLETDLNGKPGNFLAGDDDFFFVKEMHARNRIIPLVGDFAGPKTLRAVGAYLKKNHMKVSAFYVSNVEQYLYQYNVFPGFADNVKSLPIDEHSVFIRAVAARRSQHPANIPGHRLTTILQRMKTFVESYNEGGLLNYWDLVTTDYLAATLPSAATAKH